MDDIPADVLDALGAVAGQAYWLSGGVLYAHLSEEDVFQGSVVEYLERRERAGDRISLRWCAAETLRQQIGSVKEGGKRRRPTPTDAIEDTWVRVWSSPVPLADALVDLPRVDAWCAHCGAGFVFAAKSSQRYCTPPCREASVRATQNERAARYRERHPRRKSSHANPSPGSIFRPGDRSL